MALRSRVLHARNDDRQTDKWILLLCKAPTFAAAALTTLIFLMQFLKNLIAIIKKFNCN